MPVKSQLPTKQFADSLSGLIERDLAFERRGRLPRLWSRPGWASTANDRDTVANPTGSQVTENGFIGEDR